MKSAFRFLSACFFLLSGAFILIFNRKNYKPIYRGFRYFMEHKSYQIALGRLKADPGTLELLETRYRQGEQVNWDHLKRLPHETLGFQFARFMNHPEVTPLERLPEAKTEINPEIDYLRQRIRLIHDIHHVVCGYPADELGEMGISAFYVAQIQSPLNSMLLAFGLIKCTIKMPERLPELMREICRGYEMGLRSRNLFGVKWEEMWSLPLSKVREELGVVVP
jgi:ubiquinone biosynthesis protein Coq4